MAASIWSNFIRRCSLAWCCPKNIADIVESWMGGYFVGCGCVLWWLIPFAILWSIWKERNSRIFLGSSFSVANLISTVAIRIAKWALVRKEFSISSMDDNLSNWEACMGCGSIQMRRVVPWSPSIWGFKVQCGWCFQGQMGAGWYWRCASQ